MDGTFLAFDCGATSCRAVLARFANGGFSMASTLSSTRCRFAHSAFRSERRSFSSDLSHSVSALDGFMSQSQ